MLKPFDNSAIGVLLYAFKDGEVVEYTQAAPRPPALMAQYETHLLDNALLQSKLQQV